MEKLLLYGRVFKERANVHEKNVVSDNNYLSGADMTELLANTQDRVAMTMASRTKAYQYAIGFGSDKMQRIKAALLALAAAMTCDLNNCERVRTRHPEFTILCRRVGIDTDSDGIVSELQQILEQEDCRVSDGRESLHQD